MKQQITTIIFLLTLAHMASAINISYANYGLENSYKSMVKVKENGAEKSIIVDANDKEQKILIESEKYEEGNQHANIKEKDCIGVSGCVIQSLQLAKEALLKAYKLQQIDIKVNEHDLYHRRIKVIVN